MFSWLNTDIKGMVFENVVLLLDDRLHRAAKVEEEGVIGGLRNVQSMPIWNSGI